jgi:hypothetical protein
MEHLFRPTDQPGLKALGALKTEMKDKVSMLRLAKDVMEISKGLVL